MAGDQEIFSMEFGTMAGEDDEDVIVSLPGDTGATITKAADVVVKTGAGAPGADDMVTDLKSQLATMSQRVSVTERAAQEATQRATEATQRAHQAEGRVVDSQLDTVLSGLAAAEAEAASAEKDFIAAAEAGDFAAQARAQRKISTAAARVERLAEAKDDLEDAAKRRPAPGERREAPARTAPADPVEQFASGMSPRSAAWIRAHPECVTDTKLNARMLAAHNLALADDIAVDSDAYFERIEAGIKPAGAKSAPAGDGRRPSSAAAPASGAGGNLNGGIEVRLTKGEAQSATDGTLVWNYPDPTGQNRWQKGDPIGLAEMARRKLEGKKAGLYDKSVSE